MRVLFIEALIGGTFHSICFLVCKKRRSCCSRIFKDRCSAHNVCALSLLSGTEPKDDTYWYDSSYGTVVSLHDVGVVKWQIIKGERQNRWKKHV